MEEPASGPQRPRAANAKAEKEKRKRSRVTPEQLVHLERFFSMDRSPTAARRKEISDMLGMQERQTQIWFQNRRAKAKLQDGKKGRVSNAEPPPDTPPQLVTGYEAELHNLCMKTSPSPSSLVPTFPLALGAESRASPGNHDLVAYLSDTQTLPHLVHPILGDMALKWRSLSISSSIPNSQMPPPGSGLASFYLSQPPTFTWNQPRPILAQVPNNPAIGGIVPIGPKTSKLPRS
ncbi:hypothetical protein EV363DRAFT_874614 [Boletus edulis]|nr:hypothetical protein EV363DRAFT_874614 [Boletus edulis]